MPSQISKKMSQAKRARHTVMDMFDFERECVSLHYERELALLKEEITERFPEDSWRTHIILSSPPCHGMSYIMGTNKVAPSRWNPLGLPYTPSFMDPTAGTLDDVFQDRRGGDFTISSVITDEQLRESIMSVSEEYLLDHIRRLRSTTLPGTELDGGQNPQEAGRNVVDDVD
jgi:hypothetical protein